MFNCPLVFACDSGYAMQLATALRSAMDVARHRWPVPVYILSGGFSEIARQRITDSLPQGSCSIRWIPVDLAPYAAFSTLRHISTITYARLAMCEVLPRDLRKVLYLDADLLALDDLSPLLDFDLEGAAVGAVVDERLDAYIKAGYTTMAGSPLPHVDHYFNAGVLLIDLPRWRSERISEKAMGYLQRCPHSAYSDQDALNVACDGLWKQLDSRWNYYQIDLRKRLVDLSPAERPGIIHFQGWQKPWDPAALNLDADFYNSFRSRTLFARTTAEVFRQSPLVAWARVKRTLKRSAVVSCLWNRLRAFAARRRRRSSRRASAYQRC